MPSLSKAALDELNSARDMALAEAADKRQRLMLLSQQVKEFDAILDKIVQASLGRQFIDSSSYSNQIGGFGNVHRCQPPTPEELQATEIRELNERVVRLESRLAAVAAIAEFAKVHKS